MFVDVKILFLISITILALVILSEGNFLNFAFSEKNPQAECIKGQNEGFIGKEQKGDAYEHSKDTCQSLSK